MNQWKTIMIGSLQLCAVIPQRPDDIYLRKAFKEGLQNKVKMAIINMPRRTLA